MFKINLSRKVLKKSNSSHLRCKAGLPDISIEDNPRAIPARLYLIWFSGFRGEDKIANN
jgi:hypothetical protein